MQSETADFAHCAATWRTRAYIRALSLILAHSLLYVKTTTSSTKPEVKEGKVAAADRCGGQYYKLLM